MRLNVFLSTRVYTLQFFHSLLLCLRCALSHNCLGLTDTRPTIYLSLHPPPTHPRLCSCVIAIRWRTTSNWLLTLLKATWLFLDSIERVLTTMMRRCFSTGKKLTNTTIIPVPVNLGQPNMGLDSAPK